MWLGGGRRKQQRPEDSLLGRESRVCRRACSRKSGGEPPHSISVVRARLVEEGGEEVIDGGAEEGCAGDGKDPGPDDVARNAPAYGREAVRSAYAHDGAGDGVGGADRNTKARGGKQGDRTGGLRGKPSEGGEFGDALAHGLDDAPAACHGAATHGEVAADNHPVRNCVVLHQSAGNHGSGDDAHAFLCVVSAVTQAIPGSRDQLQTPEPAVHAARPLIADHPGGEHTDQPADEHAEDGRKEDEKNRHGPAMEDERFKAGVNDRRAAVTAHKRVRGTCWQSQCEGKEVPHDRAEQAGEKHLLIHHFDVDHPFADGAGDGGAEDEGGDEIPEGGPEDGAKRGQNARGDDGGDGIGGVVPAVRELEGEGDADGKGNESEAVHGDQLFFKMTLSMTLETSSHLSTAVSMTSKISFHLMI